MVIFYGDTKTCKSEISKDCTDHGTFSNPLGEYLCAESGKRTGFLYTIDPDKRVIIWGSFILNDLGYITLDGMQNISSEEMGEFREAFNNQKVVVRRMVSGEALLRVRLIGCFNPKNPMNEYLYPCMAITDSWVFKNTPDISRFDAYIPFKEQDVSKGDIANREIQHRPIPENVYEKHIRFIWSRRPEDINYTSEAKTLIKVEAERIMNEYSAPAIPIVHNGFRDTLCRIAVATACEYTYSDEKIVVEDWHVRRAVNDCEELFALLQLKEFKLESEGKRALNESELITILKELDETDFNILNEIKLEAVSSAVLAEKLGVSDRTVKEHYAHLKAHNLITTQTKRGVGLSPRGVKFLNLLENNKDECDDCKQKFSKEELVAFMGKLLCKKCYGGGQNV